jgi:hypothetical protein
MMETQDIIGLEGTKDGVASPFCYHSVMILRIWPLALAFLHLFLTVSPSKRVFHPVAKGQLEPREKVFPVMFKGDLLVLYTVGRVTHEITSSPISLLLLGSGISAVSCGADMSFNFLLFTIQLESLNESGFQPLRCILLYKRTFSRTT